MTANNVRIGVGVAGAKQAASEVDQLKDKFAKLRAEGAKGFAIGAGAAVASKGFDILHDAIHEVTNVIGDVVHAGLAEEISLNRLQTSLKANVKGWDGNLEAINKTITAHDRLGFTEGEQRDSLARLVAATHDINKAFAVQQVAMDLARFKGISLADATEALTKVEAGSFRILKSLGIALKEGATQTEALAAVEKVASGQAEAFAETTGGKLAAAQVKLDAAMEHLGEVTLPLVAGAADLVSSALDGVDGAGKDLGGRAAGYGKRVERTMTGMADNAGKSADDFDISTRGMAKSIADVGTSAVDAADKARTAFNRIVTAADRARDALLADGKALVDGYYDPLIAHDRLVATQAEITKNKRILASATATKAEKHDASVALHQLDKDNVQYLEDLASAGGSGSKLVQKAMSDYLKKLATAHGAERRAINAEIIRLEVLAAKAWNAAQSVAKIGDANANDNTHGRASGGPVTKGTPYIVGENHPEVFVPESNGTIIPNAPQTVSGGTSGGGSGGGMIVVPVPSSWSPAMQQQFARDAAPAMARELRRQGLL